MVADVKVRGIVKDVKRSEWDSQTYGAQVRAGFLLYPDKGAKYGVICEAPESMLEEVRAAEASGKETEFVVRPFAVVVVGKKPWVKFTVAAPKSGD